LAVRPPPLLDAPPDDAPLEPPPEYPPRETDGLADAPLPELPVGRAEPDPV
jgi:hypothetical protein